jgi:hypothetical protein
LQQDIPIVDSGSDLVSASSKWLEGTADWVARPVAWQGKRPDLALKLEICFGGEEHGGEFFLLLPRLRLGCLVALIFFKGLDLEVEIVGFAYD